MNSPDTAAASSWDPGGLFATLALEEFFTSIWWSILVAATLAALAVMFLAARARRREVERALVMQKERYERAIRHSTEGMWDWDIYADTTYWSRRMAETLGIPEDSSRLGRGDLWQTRLHPDDRAPVLARLKAHLEQNQPYDVEYRLRIGDGSYRWYRSRGRAERDERGRPVRMTGSLADVTEQVRTREALREREERYRLAVEAGRVAVWAVDARTGEIAADALLAELHTGSRDARPGPRMEDLLSGLHPDDRDRVTPQWSECLAGRCDRYDVEVRAVHPGAGGGGGGRVRWLQIRGMIEKDAHGAVVAIRGTTQDVTDRREALEELRQTQARLQAITDNVPGMVYSSVQRAGLEHEIVYVSQGCRALLGVEPAALVDRRVNIANLVLPEDRGRLFDASREQGPSEGERQIEYRVKAADGTIKWARDAARFRRRADGTVLWDGMLIDESAIRAADEARALIDGRYRLVVEASRAGVWDLDLRTGECYVSDELARRYGLDGVPPGAVMARWRELTHADDRAEADAALASHLDASTPYDLEYRVRTADAGGGGGGRGGGGGVGGGEYRWIRARGRAERDADGRAVRMIGSVVDVHERKVAEIALRESEHKYRTIVETADEGIWLVDQDWRTTFINARMAEMLGRTPESMLGKTIDAFMDEEGRQIAAAYQRRREDGVRERHEFKFVRPDNSPVWTSISTNPVLRADGSFAGALAMVTDVTAQRESDLAVRRMRRLFLSGPVVTWHWRNAPGWPVEYVSENVSIFGYAAEEFMTGARSFASIVHPDDLSRVGEEVAGHARRGASMFRQDYRVITADGRTRWITDYSVIERDTTGAVTHFAGYTFDDTERKGQEQIRSAERRVLEMIAGGAPLDDALEAIVGLIDEVDHALAASVLLINPDGTVRSGPAPRLSRGYTRALNGQRLGPDTGSCGRALATGRRVVTPDIAADPLWERFRAAALADGRRACWSEPILGTTGEILGTLAVYAPTPMEPSQRDIDLVQTGAHLAGIVIERRLAEQTLRDREQRLRLLVDSTPLGVITFDPSFRIVEWNRGAERIFGYPAGEVIGRSGEMLIPPDAREYVDRIVRDLLSNRGGFRGTNANIRKDGERIVCEWYNSPLIGPDGRVIAVACVVDDVTQAREAQRRQDLLMVELDHRVKNNLATIMSMAQQTAQAAMSSDDFLKAFFGRLRAMARMHAALARTNWRGVDIEALLRDTFDSYAPGAGSRYQLRGDSLTLSPRASQAMAIAFNELATNAVKYGALSAPGGMVHVSWTVAPGDPPEATIEWRESGGPAVHEPTRRGLGCSLVEAIIAHELGGKATLQFDPAGVSCSFRFLLRHEETPDAGPQKALGGTVGTP